MGSFPRLTDLLVFGNPYRVYPRFTSDGGRNSLAPQFTKLVLAGWDVKHFDVLPILSLEFLSRSTSLSHLSLGCYNQSELTPLLAAVPLEAPVRTLSYTNTTYPHIGLSTFFSPQFIADLSFLSKCGCILDARELEEEGANAAGEPGGLTTRFGEMPEEFCQGDIEEIPWDGGHLEMTPRELDSE